MKIKTRFSSNDFTLEILFNLILLALITNYSLVDKKYCKKYLGKHVFNINLNLLLTKVSKNITVLMPKVFC